MLGFEAALFVPTGSMGNQISLRVHGRSGTEVIVEERSHVFHYEMGAMAALSGLLPRPVAGPGGRMPVAGIEAWIRPESVYYLPRTSVVCLENTHNFAGGTVLPRPAIEEVLVLARKRGLAVHLDGARLWNAAAALGVSEASLAHGVDSVMVCFSKGLRAPVGSAVAGSKTFVAEARRVRKLFGGGMRQAGVLAAAALVALEKERGRLPEDHARLARLARELAGLRGVSLDPGAFPTNILIADLDPGGLRLGDGRPGPPAREGSPRRGGGRELDPPRDARRRRRRRRRPVRRGVPRALGRRLRRGPGRRQAAGELRDDLDLDPGPGRQRGDLDGGAGRPVVAEAGGVGAVHLGEVAHVGQEDGRLHDVGRAAAGSGEDRRRGCRRRGSSPRRSSRRRASSWPGRAGPARR